MQERVLSRSSIRRMMGKMSDLQATILLLFSFSVPGGSSGHHRASGNIVLIFVLRNSTIKEVFYHRSQ